MPKPLCKKPRNFHLSKRAPALIAAGAGDDDDLLTTNQVADWLGISPQFLSIGRSEGYGPKFVRVTERRVLYRREDVIAWLKARTHSSTSEYKTGAA